MTCDRHYVEAGVLVDVFEPWAQGLGGDEWEDWVVSLWVAARHGRSAGDYEKVITLMRWMQEEIDRAFAEDWWGEDLHEDHLPVIRAAQAKAPGILDYWEERASSFDDAESMPRVRASLPAWVFDSPAPMTDDDDEDQAPPPSPAGLALRSPEGQDLAADHGVSPATLEQFAAWLDRRLAD